MSILILNEYEELLDRHSLLRKRLEKEIKSLQERIARLETRTDSDAPWNRNHRNHLASEIKTIEKLLSK